MVLPRQAALVVPQIALVILVGTLGPRVRGWARLALVTVSLVVPAVLAPSFMHLLVDAGAWSGWLAVAGLVLFVVPPVGAWLAVFALRHRPPWVGTVAALVTGSVLVVVAPFAAVVVAFVPCIATHCM